MANPEHLAILKQGVEAWNKWRKENPEVVPDLEGADLRDAHLPHADLSKANLTQANLSDALLVEADLNSATLTRADLRFTTLLMSNLSCAELSGAEFSGADLRGAKVALATLHNADFTEADLKYSDLTASKLINAHLAKADLEDASLLQADLSSSDLTSANLQAANLAGASIENANLKDSNLSGTRLIRATLTNAVLTGCHLWATQREEWSIKGVICEYVYWDEAGKQRTDYAPGEFERLHSEGVRIELHYEGGISTAEISSLPFLLRHLEEAHEGCVLRFKSIDDAPGGARVTFIVDETGGADSITLKARLEEEGQRCQAALRTLSLERESRQHLEEEHARLKERVFPFLLQAAERSLLPATSKILQAVVLFSDLTGFSKLGDVDRADTLQLLRGILKTILTRWQGDYPNMWGDALRATFENVNDALECACRIQTS